jgi:hypothetical protein
MHALSLSYFPLHSRPATMPLPPKTRFASSAPPGRRSHLADHLAAADSFVRLAEHANRLRRLQNLLDTALPAYLSPGTHVANLKQGKVIIHADSGAVAVKLRQLAPRLAAEFCQQGQEVTGIEVRVQGRHGHSPGIRKKTPKVIGLQSKQVLTSLASGLDEFSPIRRALEKLLKNR